MRTTGETNLEFWKRVFTRRIFERVMLCFYLEPDHNSFPSGGSWWMDFAIRMMGKFCIYLFLGLIIDPVRRQDEKPLPVKALVLELSQEVKQEAKKNDGSLN